MIVNKTKHGFTFTREGWREYFRYFLHRNLLRAELVEGARFPRFYLPVRMPPDRDVLELWILPLAPFVWLFYVLADVFWIIWSDMLDLQRMLRMIIKAHKNNN